MAVYEYTARDATGKVLAGAIEADTDATVTQKLREMGFFITSLQRKNQAVGVGEYFARFKGIGLKDLAIFSRQFATMVNAGLSLVRTLSILEEQTTQRQLRAIIGEVRTDIEGGATLSAALGKHPRAFSNLYVNMVKAGEAGGVLDEVLVRLAAFLEKELALRQKIKSATTYPILLACAAIAALLFMTVVIIPQFATFFKELGSNAALPLPTQIAMGVSILIRRFWWMMILAMVPIVYLTRLYVRTPAGRASYDQLKLRLPILGPVNKKIVIARFSRTFGTLVASGVPIMQALEVVGKAIDNTVLARAVESVRSSIREGESIAIPLAASGMFPPMVVQMVKVGEETGALETMLTKVADFYDTEIEATVAGLTSILEPVLIVGMGIVIGAMLISLYLPIFNLALSVK
ncbi:MAG TPA: type II secretion system F family protein [bacterium]|nr:type II secretion system F family protein [bacterium]